MILLRKKELKNMEWGLLVVVIILTIIGLVALFSATQNTEYDEFKKQIIWFGISLVAMIIFMLVDYEALVKLSPFFYGGFILLLIAVLFTKPINGASSWFNIGGFSFQPGEFAKIFVILFLAMIITKIQKQGKQEINKPLKLLIVLASMALPVLLIIKQPDYGTAIAFFIATALMLFSAGIDKKYIIIVILLITISIPLLYNFVLPEHAKKRIDIFLHPESDPRGAGYNIIQSKLAIGAGRINRNGIIKRKPNTIRLFISKNNRLYIFCNRRRNGLYSGRNNYYIVCHINNKGTVCCQNFKRYYGNTCSLRNSRGIHVPYDRKYRNGNGIITYNRCTTSIY